jgi:protein-S-isoprenylcysteine O-methyltransferase Ste14
MPIEPLRIAAYCTYLAAWLVFAISAFIRAIPARSAEAKTPFLVTVPVVAGTLLQAVSALPITLALPEGPLRPRTFELAAALALAPLGAALFVWANRSAPHHAGQGTLVTQGAYRWLRHPIYLAFLAMLLATGLLASSVLRLAVAVAFYLAGSELRIATEEAELAERFPGEFGQYRLRTRWRYLPGLR